MMQPFQGPVDIVTDTTEEFYSVTAQYAASTEAA
jgi:hypothetical protein